MGVIFLFSTDTFSGSQTSRFIGPILKWFAPDITNDSIALVQLAVRKIAHLVEYAILSMLICRALAKRLAKPLPLRSLGQRCYFCRVRGVRRMASILDGRALRFPDRRGHRFRRGDPRSGVFRLAFPAAKAGHRPVRHSDALDDCAVHDRHCCRGLLGGFDLAVPPVGNGNHGCLFIFKPSRVAGWAAMLFAIGFTNQTFNFGIFPKRSSKPIWP